MALDLARRRVTISASQLERIARCPGSWKLSLRAPEQPLSPEAEHGVRVHALLAGQSPEDVTDAEQIEAREAWETVSWLVYSAMQKPLSDLQVRREWQAFIELGPATLSGRYDLVVWDKQAKQGIVVDYKTGRQKDLELDQNLQLAAGAVTLAELQGLEKVHVALVETWRGRYTPEWWTYDTDDLKDARQVLTKILAEAVKEEPRLEIGAHCKYCPAITICPRSVEIVKWAGGKPKETAAEYAAALPADRLALLLTEWKEWVVHVGRALEAEAKRRLESGEEVPGWTLRNSGKSREITDVAECWRRLKRMGVEAEAFLRHVKIDISDVHQLIQQTGLQGKELRAAVEYVLEGITIEKDRAPILQQVKQ